MSEFKYAKGTTTIYQRKQFTELWNLGVSRECTKSFQKSLFILGLCEYK